jgi:hypothetical protein
VHASGRRRRGQRILYFFRTPPGVRVGRAPIDEDAIRLLEQHNPDVQFDWSRLLGGAEGADPTSRSKSIERMRGGRGERGERGERGARRERAERRERGPRSTESRGDAVGAPSDREGPSAAAVPPPSDLEAAALSASPPSDSLSTSFSAQPDEYDGSALSAAHERLGSETLGRLRARHAEVMARIAEQEVDDETREQLKARADRLNPDTWVTADEVDAALEQYETVLEGLRALVGRHPRRGRGPQR